MKKLLSIATAATMLACIACGPSAEETAKKAKMQADSARMADSTKMANQAAMMKMKADSAAKAHMADSAKMADSASKAAMPKK